jgi:hypothetical protein
MSSVREFRLLDNTSVFSRKMKSANAVHPSNFLPYSLSVNDAAAYFGFAPQTLYDWISCGKLTRGTHYLKIGKKVVILRDAFIELLHKEDGTWQSE